MFSCSKGILFQTTNIVSAQQNYLVVNRHPFEKYMRVRQIGSFPQASGFGVETKSRHIMKFQHLERWALVNLRYINIECFFNGTYIL